jgi:hypothetical protein
MTITTRYDIGQFVAIVGHVGLSHGEITNILISPGSVRYLLIPFTTEPQPSQDWLSAVVRESEIAGVVVPPPGLTYARVRVAGTA